eukprot:scaffold19246_cov32-Phaeocystis_antarctica.AAC.2
MALQVVERAVAVGARRVQPERLAQLDHLLVIIDEVLRGRRLLPHHHRVYGRGAHLRRRAVEALCEGLEHVLVAAVVADAHNEVDAARGGVELRDDVVHHDALVDAVRPHLDVALALLDVDGRLGQDRGEVLREQLGLHRSELGVDVVVLPHERAPFVLDHRAVCALRESLEYGESRLLPGQVRILDELLPPALTQAAHAREVARLEDVAVLRRQRGALHLVHWLRQLRTVVVDERAVELRLHRDKRAAPVEEDGAAARVAVSGEDLGGVELAEGGAHADTAETSEPEADGGDLIKLLVALGAASHGGEVLEDALGPRARGVGREELKVALLPQQHLGGLHEQRALQRDRELLRMPR